MVIDKILTDKLDAEIYMRFAVEAKQCFTKWSSLIRDEDAGEDLAEAFQVKERVFEWLKDHLGVPDNRSDIRYYLRGVCDLSYRVWLDTYDIDKIVLQAKNKKQNGGNS